MAEAIIKVNWRVKGGHVDPASVQGGICGTAFTLANGRTYSAAQIMRGVFIPNPGTDRCFVALAGRDGHFAVIDEGQVHIRKGWDVAEITGYASPDRYALSDTVVDGGMLCGVHAYLANVAPFKVALSPRHGEVALEAVDVAQAAQDQSGLVPQATRLNVTAADVNIADKPGFMLVHFGKTGLGGAPLFCASDGGVVGICLLGLPPDGKPTRIAAVDMRALLQAQLS